MLSDIEIAQSAELKPIAEIANQLGISADELEFYGKYKAKLSDELADLSLIHISEPTRPY